jgi:anti-anti-sigma factor
MRPPSTGRPVDDRTVPEGPQDPPSLRIEIWSGETATTVRLFGELEDDSAGAVDELLRRLLGERDERGVVVDLRGLTFIDSAGIEALVAVQEASRDSARSYGVIRGPRLIQRLLRLAGADQRLTFVSEAGR